MVIGVSLTKSIRGRMRTKTVFGIVLMVRRMLFGVSLVRLMMIKRIIKNADEQDAYTIARRFYTYLTRAGAVKKIKKATHRRERRESKRWIEEQLND